METQGDGSWVQVDEIQLIDMDKRIIVEGDMLDDRIMHVAHVL